MIKTAYDPKHNAVILEFAGKIDAAQAERLYLDIQEIVPRHGKGFKLLTDLTGVQEVSPEIRGAIKRLMDFLNGQGVTEILRVIPDPDQDIGLNIMSLFHCSKDVKFLTLQSREEAQARL